MAQQDRGELMRAVRLGLVAFGVAMLVLGAVITRQTVSTQHIAGLIVWMICALIIHDGIIAPIVFGVGVVMRKTGKTIPVAVLGMVQAAIVVGSVFSIIVFPEIYAKHLGTANVTVLPFDYALRLALLWAAIAILTAGLVLAYYAVTRRQKDRPLASQA
jgi:hypothetical protein